MNNIIKKGAFAVLLVVYALVPITASAAMMQHLHLSDTVVDPGWGNFRVTAESCGAVETFVETNGCASYMPEFELTIYDLDGYAFEFGVDQLVSETLMWDINQGNWDLDMLYLETTAVAAVEDLTVGNTLMYATAQLLIPFNDPNVGTATLFACPDQACETTVGSIVYDLHATHVPEPTTFGLLTLGLAALGFSRRKRRIGQAIPA